MSETPERLRAHVVRLLDWEEAHAGFDAVVDGIPAHKRGARPGGFEHSPWQLLEHMRRAQEDLLDFCVNAHYTQALRWPDDYWPPDAEPPGARVWSASVAGFKSDREKLQRLARDTSVDLFALVPTGTGQQTYLRTLLLAADHNAYHLGQLVAVRRALGVWP